MSWENFKKQFPNADFLQFKEVDGDIIFKPTGEVLYRKGDLQEKTLSHILAPPPPFPEAYVETSLEYPSYTPQPEDGFSKKVTNLEIPVGGRKFDVKVRNIFKDFRLTHTSGKEARTWLRGPNFRYWPQQLSFAVWAATKGCGVAMDMFNVGFLRFHVAFTMRRLLKELGVPLPGDKNFDRMNNPYNKVALERLMNEFKPKSRDFRYRVGKTNGLGIVYKWDIYRGVPAELQGQQYPGPREFYDLGGRRSQENLITKIQTLYEAPWDPFILHEGKGLKNLGRINRSIEAFVYCILGAQVNTRSPIVSAHGASQETQQEFLTLFESAVIENDISKSVQRYQLAVQQSKVRLDYALSPGCWLMPSNLVINTQAVVGYNNKLQRATADMKFGANDINMDTTGGLPHVDTKKTHIDTPPKKIPTPKSKLKPLPTIREEPEYDHYLLKAGMSLGAVGLGFYIWR